MRAGIALVAVLVAACAALPAAGEALTPATPVTETGVGPIRFGMTPAEAEAAAGMALPGDRYELYEDGSCYYVTPEGAASVFGFMVSDGTIARVDIWETAEVATAEGARVGDTEARVLELYAGRATIEPHAYAEPEGHYVKTRTAHGAHGYVFETDGQVVTAYRAGRYPEVEYIEGCL
jgi:hypothetical protein